MKKYMVLLGAVIFILLGTALAGEPSKIKITAPSSTIYFFMIAPS